MNKSYLIAIINTVASIILAIVIALVLNFLIYQYQTSVSYSFSLAFFIYDPFTSGLVLILIVSMIINLASTAVMISGMFSARTVNNIMSLSMTSLLWIILYLSASFLVDYFTLIFLIILLLSVLAVMIYKVKSWLLSGLMIILTLYTLIFPILIQLLPLASSN